MTVRPTPSEGEIVPIAAVSMRRILSDSNSWLAADPLPVQADDPIMVVDGVVDIIRLCERNELTLLFTRGRPWRRLSML